MRMPSVAPRLRLEPPAGDIGPGHIRPVVDGKVVHLGPQATADEQVDDGGGERDGKPDHTEPGDFGDRNAGKPMQLKQEGLHDHAKPQANVQDIRQPEQAVAGEKLQGHA